jgi:hypothetical protein
VGEGCRELKDSDEDGTAREESNEGRRSKKNVKSNFLHLEK